MLRELSLPRLMKLNGRSFTCVLSSVYYMSSLCKYFSFRIAKNKSETVYFWISSSPFSVFINDVLCRRRRLSSTLPHAGVPVAEVPGDKSGENIGSLASSILGSIGEVKDGNAQGSVINLLNPDFQVWVVIVLGVGGKSSIFILTGQ